MTASHRHGRQRLVWPLLILLLAAFLRLVQSDVYILWIDELSIHNAAIDLARDGQFTLVGNISTFDALAYHSPLTTYLIALPYFISPDPAVARWFVAFLGVLTVALVYRMTWRYFGFSAAVIAGLLLAVLPVAVDWSRFVWNPNVGLIFLALWFFTALLGYYEGKRWAQIGHWLALSATIQSQAALLTLIPMSVVLLLLYILSQARMGWSAAVRTLAFHVVCIGLAALTFVPWFVGLSQAAADEITIGRTEAIADQTLQIQLPNLAEMALTFGRIVGSVDFPGYRIGWSEVQTGMWSQPVVVLLTQLQALLALIAAVGVFVWSLRQPRHRAPYLFVGLMCAYPFGLFIINVAGEQFAEFYFMATLFAGIMALAIGLGALVLRPFWHVVAGIIGLLVVAQTAITLGYVDFLVREGGNYPVGNLATARQQAAFWQESGQNLLLIRDPEVEAGLPDEQRFTLSEIYLLWDVLSERYNVRIFTPEDNLTVADAETVVIGPSQSPILNEWLPDAQRVGPYPLYAAAATDQLFRADFVPTGADNFGGLAQLIGAQVLGTVQPGETLRLRLIWRPLLTAPDRTLQFSVRLTAADGATYSQQDRSSLNQSLWRAGETVLTQFALDVPQDLPSHADLMLQVIMYTLPDVQSLNVLDETGQPVAPYALIPISASQTAPVQ